ncbi:MAG: hypothetical protein VX519_00490 [Myxococcota bacterium]|nr:hypothetical protein [Myxococcota bacterium]
MPRRLLTTAALLLTATFLAPTEAHAKKRVVGVEMGYALGQSQQDLALRYGWRWKLATALVQADILGGTTLSDNNQASPLAMGGVTVGFGPVVQPRVFARAGMLFNDTDPSIRQSVGTALVFTMLPKVEIGINAAYNGETASGSDVRNTWWSGAAEASLAF